MAECEIIGTVKDPTGLALAPKGTKLTAMEVSIPGVAHSAKKLDFFVDSTGVLKTKQTNGSPAKFAQGARVRFYGESVHGFNKSERGAWVQIPNTATVDINALAPPDVEPSTSALSAEVVRATAAEVDLQEQLDALDTGGGAWGEIGGTLPDQSDLQTALDTKADASALTSEATARASADATLQTNITSEATARANADTTLQTNVTAEATARANADFALTSSLETVSDAVDAVDAALTAEEAARAAADTALQTNIDAEASARAAADLLLAPKASPALTGTPTAPTAATATSSTQLATTAFVQSRIGEVIGTAPANLDTLQEIAAQLATDESAASALVTTVAGKLAKASNLSDLTDAAAARGNLGLGSAAVESAANLLARGNHTGTQTASTVSDFNSAALIAAPAETVNTVGALISGASAKTTPVDADTFGLSDSAASNVLKRFSWANLKAALNTIYQTILTIGNGLSLSSGTVTVDGSKVLMDGSVLPAVTGEFPETVITLGEHRVLRITSVGDVSHNAGRFIVDMLSHDGLVHFNSSNPAANHYCGELRLPTEDDSGSELFRLGTKSPSGVASGFAGSIDNLQYNDSAGTPFQIVAGAIVLALLPNLSSQDRLLGFDNTSKQIGNVTLGSGISLSAGNLSLSAALAAIAALTPSNDDVLQRKAGVWTNRSPAQLKTDLGLSGTNSGDQTSVTGNAGTATALQTARTIDGQSFDGTANITVIAPGTHAASSKTTPVDADELPLVDSAASNVLKRLTWANLKATLKTYTDTLYQPLAAALTSIAGLSPSNDDILQRKSGAWTNRTLAQVKTDLALTSSDVGLGSVVNVIQARVLHVFVSASGSGNSGTSETDLGTTYPMPGGTMSADGKLLRISVYGSFANNANLKTVKIYFGGTVIATPVNVAANTGVFNAIFYVARTGAATQLSWGRASITNGGNETGNMNPSTTPGETMSGAITIKVTGQSGTASNDVLLKAFVVEILN